MPPFFEIDGEGAEEEEQQQEQGENKNERAARLRSGGSSARRPPDALFFVEAKRRLREKKRRRCEDYSIPLPPSSPLSWSLSRWVQEPELDTKHSSYQLRPNGA